MEERQDKIEQSPEHGRDIIRVHKAAINNLLDLRVLVQNRRKDRASVLIYGSRMQVSSYASTTGAVLRGASQVDNMVKYTRDRWEFPIHPSM